MESDNFSSHYIIRYLSAHELVLPPLDLAYEKHLAHLKLNHDHILTVFSFSLTPSPHGSYLNAIQTCCPHILRYVTAAVITNKRRQSLLKDLIRVIRQVQSHSNIPIQRVWPQSSFSLNMAVDQDFWDVLGSTVMAVVLGCIIVLVVDHIPSTGILLCPPGPHQGICGVSLCQL